MNDLRLLYQVDRQRKIINLQYKQITSLQPLLPILAKFQNLQTLSLYGNRLKSLPDMGVLKNVVQIDLSNNLFNDYKHAIKGLKSLSKLRHLIYTFKNEQQEQQIKNQLPQLQRINKKPTNNKITTKKMKKNQLKLQQKDLEEIGQIYDQIRDIYKKSKYMVDKELMQDFDKSVDIIMADLGSRLNSAKSSTELDTGIITCRYGLIDMCFTKIITYFYHFDRNIAIVLEKIHDYIAESFKSMNQILKIQQQKINIQMHKVKTKKQQLYKQQIKRLKQKDLQLLSQVQLLEKKNTQLLRVMAQYGRSQSDDKNLFRNAIQKYADMENLQQQLGVDSVLRERKMVGDNYGGMGRSASKGKSRQISPFKERQITKTEQYQLRNNSKKLTLNQLKEIITDIYNSKAKQNKICREAGQAMQTMQEYMYTYLNQRYGLKNLTIDWAMGIVNGIKKYSATQPQIAVFGKVLRNQIQQGFQQNVKKLKNTLHTQTKKFKGPNCTQDSVSFNQAEQILLNCRYSRDTSAIILCRLKEQFASNGLIPFDRFQNALLQYYIRQHQEQIKYFCDMFKQVDRDEDGAINRQQLKEILSNWNKTVDEEILFEYIDPFITDKLTFSWVYEALLKDQTYRQILVNPKSVNQDRNTVNN